MVRLPAISSRECLRALYRAGFEVVRVEGSHFILRRKEPFAQTVVPNHGKLGRGILRTIIRQAGMTVDEFVELLGK